MRPGKIARLLLAGGSFAAALSGATTLSNNHITAAFTDRGLASLRDAAIGATFHFGQDHFSVTLDGKRYDSAALDEPVRRSNETTASFSYSAGPYSITATYELRPGWRFVSKQLTIGTTTSGRFTIDELTLFRNTINEPIKDTYVIARARPNLGTGDYGACLRFDKSRGLLVTAQN